MFAASSNSTSIGGSSRPPRRSAAATPARSTRSVSAATSGAADPPPSLLSRYRVCREAGNAAASNSANPRPAGGGVTQAVIAGLRRHLAATRAVKYTEPRVSGGLPWVPSRDPARPRRSELRELATTIKSLKGSPSFELNDLSKPQNTAYHRAFELIETLCERYYPGTESTRYVEDYWEPQERTIPDADMSGWLVPVPSDDKLQAISRLLSISTMYTDLTVAVVNTTLSDGYI